MIIIVIGVISLTKSQEKEEITIEDVSRVSMEAIHQAQVNELETQMATIKPEPSTTEKVVSTTKTTTKPAETTKAVETTASSNSELKYDEPYYVCDNPLNAPMGVKYYNGHRETWYSQKVLPGGGLRIPGRHVAQDGTIRDGDGYIVVASDLSYLSRGSIVQTSLGPGKVYDTGCPYGTIDIYVNW